MFGNTREFAQAIAREAGLRITMLDGTEPAPVALRAMRLASRTWFEGVSPLLESLLQAPASWPLPPTCLRVSQGEVSRLRFPALWSAVSDLIVPSQAAAAAVRAAMAAQAGATSQGLPPEAAPVGRVHVVGDILRQIRGEVTPREDVLHLLAVLLKQPGQLESRKWETIDAVARACRGRVLVSGNAPQELLSHLSGALGLQVMTEADLAPSSAEAQSPAMRPDCLVLWESLAADAPTTSLDAALERLRPGGTVIAVDPTLPAPRGRSATATARILSARLPGRDLVRLLDNTLMISGSQEEAVIPSERSESRNLAGVESEIAILRQVPTISFEATTVREQPEASDFPPRRRRTPPPTYRGRRGTEISPLGATEHSGAIQNNVIPSERSESRNLAVENTAAPVTPRGPSTSLGVTTKKDVPLPLVTAIIPVYNDAARVGRAIDSLRRQTWPNLEILVIDDGSTDDTAQAVAKHLTDRRVRYLYKPHSGRPETRNLGVEQARGDYVAWLGSDDESMPNRIAAQMDAVRADPSIDIVHSDGLFIGYDGSLRECRRYEPFTPAEFPHRLFLGLARVCPILDTSALIRRRLYDRLGLYDLAFPRCQDYEFYLRAAMAEDVRYAHVPLTLVRVHQGPPSPERTRLVVDFYALLARRMLEFFGPERLMAPLARDLHIDSRLATGEVYALTAVAFQTSPNHAVSREAEARLHEVVEKGAPADRIDANKLLGLLALSYGDSNLATLYFGRAREVAAQAIAQELSVAQQSNVIPSERSESRNLAVRDSTCPISQRAPSTSLGVTTQDELPATSGAARDGGSL
jgi:glycosyltransferase involved in cell wall biosynthesis